MGYQGTQKEGTWLSKETHLCYQETQMEPTWVTKEPKRNPFGLARKPKVSTWVTKYHSGGGGGGGGVGVGSRSRSSEFGVGVCDWSHSDVGVWSH